ncbi:hypothetical protein RH831_11775 [Halodesulfurarchaeum sp. HSR-GB]|uniref:hypothetical protein n=1 Tax=Halodesulfurarchaeum sp. HSR-GB TaxID=3074077 RepID=UPI0028645061|nr:hypothetical protein [Halodesulfurarchaeum sp. HSR-GB]MDR5657850.1 hypothetical protein [Halodesulfurarchaeum sp. HSR-GB]
MVAISALLSGAAVLLSVLAIIAVYDRLIRKAIYHFYDPHIDLTLQGAGEDTVKQFHVEEGEGHIPTYHDEFEIPYYKLPERDPTVDRFDADTETETRSFSISVHGQDTKKATIQLRIRTRGSAVLRFEPRRLNDPTDPIEITRDGPDKVYEFPRSEISNVEPYWAQANFEIQMNEKGTYRVFRLSGEVDYTINASEFSIPIIGWQFPEIVGDIEFPPIRREWEILGPDHDEVDLEVAERYDTLETKKVEPEQRQWVAVKDGTPVAKFDVNSTTEIPVSCDVEYVDDLDTVERDPSVLTEEEQHFFGAFEVES